MKEKLRCQMTVGEYTLTKSYGKCYAPAKFRVPVVKMGIEYVCGTHARSMNKMFERLGQNIRCKPLKEIK
jgi:hypothetical protein